MIRLEHLTKLYGELTAVNDLTLEMGDSRVNVLIGPSGCGKTTTLRMINRLTEPSSGRVLLDGRDTSELKPEQLRRSMGYVIQSIGLFPHMTVSSNVAVVPHLLGWEEGKIRARVAGLLELVGLDPAVYGPKYPSELSGGEAQRIGVARALAADPPVLLMDEPFGAVDPLTRQRLQLQFMRIQKDLKKTVVLVTHDLDEAIRMADKVAILDKGKLVQWDVPETLLTNPANKFVHDFVGADRALKRLARVSVKGYIKPASAVRNTASPEQVRKAADNQKWLWVSDDDGRLIGWVDMQAISQAPTIEQAVVRGKIEELAVAEDATLREALSRMLGQGFKYVPVVDRNGVLVGEVTLSDVESATSEVGKLNE